MQKIDTIRLIGFYQIIGGLVGWLMIGVALITGEGLFKNIAVVVVSGFVLFSFSIVCGWLLLTNNKLGIRLSSINQGLQVLMIGLGSFLFKYSSGIYLALGVDVTENTKIKTDVGMSIFHLNINLGEQWDISINLVAVWLLTHLLRLQENRKEYNVPVIK